MTLANKVVKLTNGVAFVSISPFVVHQEDIKKSKALLRHVEKPHAHTTRPNHEPNELFTIYEISESENRRARAYKVNLEEKLPVGQTLCARISWLA